MYGDWGWWGRAPRVLTGMAGCGQHLAAAEMCLHRLDWFYICRARAVVMRVLHKDGRPCDIEKTCLYLWLLVPALCAKRAAADGSCNSLGICSPLLGGHPATSDEPPHLALVVVLGCKPLWEVYLSSTGCAGGGWWPSPWAGAGSRPRCPTQRKYVVPCWPAPTTLM